MYLKSKINLTAVIAPTTMLNGKIRLVINSITYTEKHVGVQFSYYLESVDENDTLVLTHIPTDPYPEISKAEADYLANIVEQQIPSTITSAFDYEFYKFYLGAMMKMYQVYLKLNPTLKLSDIEIINE